MAKITTMLATPKTDAKLAKKYGAMGIKAKLAGKTEADCPFSSGMVRYWWIEGYRSI